MWHELRAAVRAWSRTPALAAALVLILGLGIAANTVVLTILNAFVRDLPFDEPDRIVDLATQITTADRVRVAGLSAPEFRDWQANSRTFDGIGAYREAAMNVADASGPAPERLRGAYVSANTFKLIGETPALGRDFLAEDDSTGAAPVAILSYAVWMARYGGDPSVVGRAVRVNGVTSRVIGVMPERFAFPRNAEVWQPLALRPVNELQRRDVRPFSAIGRLRAGVTIEQARADLRSVTLALADQFPATNAGIAPRVLPFREAAIGPQASIVNGAMMAAVALLLLIACANVANLLLARSVDRSREISVRVSLGASRWVIIRQLLAEGLVLAGVAGVVGLWLSWLGVVAYRNSYVDATTAYWFQFTMDTHVLAFLVTSSLGTVLLFSLAPALHAARTSIADVLLEGGRASSGSIRSRRWMGALVVVQLALAIILLTGAGLAARDAVSQARTEVGIDTAGLTLMRLSLPPLEYPTVERRATFFRQLGDRLASHTQLRGTFASAWPHGGTDSGPMEISIDGQPGVEAGRRPVVSPMAIGPRYFATLGVAPVRGRDFSDTERPGSAIVNERFAALHFPKGDPIGQLIRLEANGEAPGSEWLTIVGVVPNVRQRTIPDDRNFDPVVYVPYASRPMTFAMILVRSDLSQTTTSELLRNDVRALDPDLPLYNISPLDEVLAENLSESRELGTMFGIFAAIALFLAAAGLYGVTAYAVSQRTREIGIRIALGAPAGRIWWHVTRRAALHIGVGLVLGLTGALAAGRIFEGLLRDISGTDPLTFGAVPTFLLSVMAIACYVPARRAMRLDPIAALRQD